MIHIDPDLVTEELDQLDRQLWVSADDCEVAFFVDDADLGGFQCFARHFMKGSLAEDMFLDQLTRAQDADDLPPASCRRASELDLARAQQVEAQAHMTFVEHGLVRRILELAFNVLEFGEIVSGNIAQDDLLANPAGVTIFDKAGLPFHDSPIPGTTPTPCNRMLLETR